MEIVNCPICEKEFHKKLYTLGFIHCAPWGCGIFFDPETKKVLPIDDEGRVIVENKKPKEAIMKYKIYYRLKDTQSNRDIYARTGSLSQFQKLREKEQSFIAETDDIGQVIAEIKTDKNKSYRRCEEVK